MNGLDAHARPPDYVRTFYKIFQKRTLDVAAEDLLLDCNKPEHLASLRVVRTLNLESLLQAFALFSSQDTIADVDWPRDNQNLHAYEHPDLPGLHIVPSALPASVQEVLLNRLLHRDLSKSEHLTNVHKFYNVIYPSGEANDEVGSFFSVPPSSTPMFEPIDPNVHKPMSINSFMGRKLRWATLGGQYDWTAKVYPEGQPPTFPQDIAMLLKGLFPEMEPEAAIVNLYTPGDTLSMHRDVAEFCDQGLTSVSIGCDAIFVISLNEDQDDDDQGERKPVRPLAIRLRSGDAVYMSGPSRFAWHGVPQIVPHTCPDFLKDWPASRDDSTMYEPWRGWMSNKRINLNVRQMFDQNLP